jgi:hypothetical protein
VLVKQNDEYNKYNGMFHMMMTQVVIMCDDDLSVERIRLLVEEEIAGNFQDLRHLIYPLNYSSKTESLNERQERFSEMYVSFWTNWSWENILCRLPSKAAAADDDDNASHVVPLTKECLLRQLLVLFLAECGYDSRTRTLLLCLSQRLGLSSDAFVLEVELVVLGDIVTSSTDSMRSRIRDLNQEDSISCSSGVSSTASNIGGNSDSTSNSGISNWSRKKWIYATTGVFIGAAACSLTAGLAAPIFMPAILSAAGITAGAAFLAGSGGVAIMATLFGLAGAGMASYRVSRRFADLKDFKFIPLKDSERNRNLRVCVVISGWIRNESDFTSPWITSYLANESAHYAIQSEVYCLSFEREIMLSLGRAMQDFLKSSAVTLAASQVIKYTVTAAASSALLFPVAVLQAGDLIDNPWTLGLDRARKAGKALAEALKRGAQGRRPVTLVGYSLGALVVFTCLQELARMCLSSDDPTLDSSSLSRQQSSEDLSVTDLTSTSVCSDSLLFGIVENVVLMGLPTHLPAPSVWNQLRLLVSGRFVHCYSKSDWVLRFLYRTSSPGAMDIAGLGPIVDAPTIENFDVSEIVIGHADYQAKASEIMKLVDI